MKLISFVPKHKCEALAKRFDTGGKPYEMYVDESLIEKRFSGEAMKMLSDAFQNAADKGGEYLSNIIGSFCWLQGLNENEFAEQL